jgi:hypothetical protein
MVDQPETLPRDIDALHALIRAERSALASAMAARDAAFAERDQLAVRNAKLEYILARLRQLRHELGCQCDPKSLMWRYFIFWRHVLGKNMWC